MGDALFESLRNRFIAMMMVSITLVLAIAAATICYNEYQRADESTSYVLTASIERSIGFGKRLSGEGQPPGMPGMSQERLEDDRTQPFESPGNGSKSKLSEKKMMATPVAVYKVDSTGYKQVSTNMPSAVIDKDILEEAISRTSSLGDGRGMFGDLGLVYQRLKVSETVYVALADDSIATTWKSTAWGMLPIFLAVWGVFLILSVIFANRALRPVREAWEKQREFVADASHDLKTPITVILANMGILRKHPERTVAQEMQWVENTLTEASRMNDLVCEMLELAKLEDMEEKGERYDTVCPISEIAQFAEMENDAMALEHGCLFECDIESDIEVLGDRAKLEKVFSTLLENAFKYAGEGGTVEMSLRRLGGQAVISIKNTGTEIPPDEVEHVFDRFYRADKSRNADSGGFGLGLAIAKKTVEAHGGKISCTSGAGEGTEFKFCLPVSA